jgi:methylated-DNA-protein-cysteine methyltransferase-like protein
MDAAQYQRIYAAVRQIPRGKVASYGQVAQLAGRCNARVVGFALGSLRHSEGNDDVPWQRVLNSQGKCNLGDNGNAVQQQLLMKEGVHFDKSGRVDRVEDWWVDVPY